MTTELEQRIKTFADSRWPERDIPGRIRKLGEEFGELAEAVARMDQSMPTEDEVNDVILEAADCAIILTDLVALLDKSLTIAMMIKIEIVEARPHD